MQDDDDSGVFEEPDDQIDGSVVLNGAVNSFGDRYLGRGAKPISTGIRSIDRAILGFRPAKTYVIGARPGMGKTAMSTSWRRSVVSQGHVVVELNLEMGLEEIGERELAFRSGVSLRKVMSAQGLSREELGRIKAARDSIEVGLWWVYDNVFSLDGIVAKCRAAFRRAKREDKRIGLVIIDYIGLIADVNENRQQSVSQCSRTFKLLSKELDCAFVILTQLNRSCEYRDDKRPVLADIRESGSLEQDADVVAFLYRPHLYDKSISPEVAEFIIRKQRAGPIGDVPVRFNPRSVHYDDVPPAVSSLTQDGSVYDSDGVLQ